VGHPFKVVSPFFKTGEGAKNIKKKAANGHPPPKKKKKKKKKIARVPATSLQV